MRNVMLEQLYDGNVGPAHMPPYDTERGKHYAQQVDRLEEQLEGLLDEQGRKVLRRLLEARNGADSALAHGSFCHGFKMATLIMAEVFMDKESEMRDKKYYWRSRMPEVTDRDE